MTLAIDTGTALIFAPFVLPICLYVCWTDMRAMRIYNRTVILLAAVFLVAGLVALPLSTYPWRLGTMAAVLAVGVLVNAMGLMGAGDAKFIAAAVGFIDPGDAGFVMILFAVNMLAAVVTHRVVGRTPLRRMAPEWESWSRGRDFPMGLSLGGTLGLYLLAGVFLGA